LFLIGHPLPNLISNPLSDLIYEGVGAVGEHGGTVLLLVTGGHGFLVQVHAAHLFPEPASGVIEDLVTSGSALHFAGNTLAATIPRDLKDGKSGVDVVNGVEHTGEETAILDGIVVGGGRAGTSPTMTIVAEEGRQQKVDQTTESGEHQQVQDEGDDISESWIFSSVSGCTPSVIMTMAN